MNIAFEITPLITASGSFGDKSGVYRYTYGLISAFSTLMSQKHPKAKIILFSFNQDLLKIPLNPDVLKLSNQNNIVLLNKIPYMRNTEIDDMGLFEISFFRFMGKLLNIIFPLRRIYENYSSKILRDRYFSFLTRALKKNKTQFIFHSQTGFFSLKGFKNIATIYDLTPFFMREFHRPETKDLQKRKIKFVKKTCQGIISISKSTKKDLLNYVTGFKNKKIVVGYPGLDPVFQPNSPSAYNISLTALYRLLKRYHKGIKEKRYLLYYGTFEPRKNLLYLIQVFADLRNTGEIPLDFKLILSGGEGWGNIKATIIHYVKENFPEEKEKAIIVVDYLNDKYLLPLIKNAYAVVYPSLYEGFGLPVLESMALGTPVICSNNSSLPEVGGQAVLYINPHNFFDVKEKIKHLVHHPKYAETLSQRGIKQSQKFTWVKTAQKVYVFLKEL